MNPLFGVLILERDPFTLANLPGLAQAWIMEVGGFAFFGLIIYFIYALLTPTENTAGAKERAGISMPMLICGILSLFLFIIGWFMLAKNIGGDPSKVTQAVQAGYTYLYVAPTLDVYPRALVMTFAGLFATIGFCYPFFQNCLKLRFGRIYSIAKLCFIETVRNRYFFIFLGSLLIYLVPTKWFNNAIKPEDELRSIFMIPYVVMQFVTLASALLIVSFSIPNDINRQTIYTIVTKPIERLEILLGKFLGYLSVLTCGLVLMVLAGMLFISTTKINETAKKETYLARVPVRGDLEFKSRKADFEGTLVGREFEYRKYISGDVSSPQRGIWRYSSLPSALENNPNGIKCEFTFDIFRLTKGEENRGVFCQIVFATHDCLQQPPEKPGDGTWVWKDKAKFEEYQKEAVARLSKATGNEENADSIRGLIGGASPNGDDARSKKIWEVAEKLAEDYGYFEVPSVEVYDYHPASVIVPASIFKNANKGTPGKDARGKTLPRLEVFVKCESRSQLLGMAKGDLYIIENINTFEANYLRSMFGLWCRIAIMVAICLSISTYLSGVISMIVSMLLYIAGYAAEHIDDVVRGTSTGGGPIQSFTNILKAEQPTAQPTENVAILGSDAAYLWVMRRVQNIFPDLDGLGWSNYVMEGFNVNYEFLLMNFIVTVSYIFPWFVLAYYLLRSREVADT